MRPEQIEQDLRELDEAAASGVSAQVITECRQALVARADRDEVIESLNRTGCPYCGHRGSVIAHQDIAVCLECNRRVA